MSTASDARAVWIATALAAGLAGCGDNRTPSDDGDAATAIDAATIDTAMIDTATIDSATIDSATIDSATTDGMTADSAPPVDAAGPDAPTCTTTVATHPLFAAPHIAQCSPVGYSTNPPTSGPHYGLWASWRAYADRVPRGFWVHNLEHGGVVVAYNCPTGCAAEVAALTAFLDARPVDPLCVAPIRNRFVVTPDPLLDTRFAASAWGWSLRSDCFDLAALGSFIDAHYAQAPENFCTDGFDPTFPGAIPPDCP